MTNEIKDSTTLGPWRDDLSPSSSEVDSLPTDAENWAVLFGAGTVENNRVILGRCSGGTMYRIKHDWHGVDTGGIKFNDGYAQYRVWCDKYCTGLYVQSFIGVWFSVPEDKLMFILKWGHNGKEKNT